MAINLRSLKFLVWFWVSIKKSNYYCYYKYDCFSNRNLDLKTSDGYNLRDVNYTDAINSR